MDKRSSGQILTSADWREFGVESSGEAAPLGGPDQKVALVAGVLDPSADPKGLSDQGGVGRLLGFPAGSRTCGIM